MEISKGNRKAKGTANVTFTDDGGITNSNDDGWGEDEGMTGTILCTAGITKSYKDALNHKPSQPNLTANTDHIFHQACSLINRKWLLLDSQSMADHALEIFSNAGLSTTDLIRDLPGFKTVWYQSDGTTNILSLSDMQKDHRVTYDSAHGNCFMVERKDGLVRKFVQSKRVTTRQLQGILGNPSLKTFIDIVDNNCLPNCPMSRQDVIAAEDIFGPNTRCLQGKTVQKDSKVVRMVVTSIPPTILERYKEA
eukprot:509707-Ditylum_brightwellii.AAC.1